MTTCRTPQSGGVSGAGARTADQNRIDSATQLPPMPARPRWLSLWTTDDQTVTPPDSARLAGALNVPIQSVCPAVQVSHSQLPTSPAVTAMVLQALGSGPVRAPTAADCG